MNPDITRTIAKNLMTIYKKGTRKYNIANKVYGKKKKSNKMTIYAKLKSNATKWVYGRLGLLG